MSQRHHSGSSPGSTSGVTREEFEAFAGHVNGTMARIENKLDRQSTPQYGSWFAAAAVLVSMAAMAAALVNGAITSSSALAIANDRAVQLQLTGYRDHTIDRLGTLSESQTRLSDRNERYKDLSAERHLEQAERISSIESTLQAIKGELNTRNSWMSQQTDLASRNDEKLKAIQRGGDG